MAIYGKKEQVLDINKLKSYCCGEWDRKEENKKTKVAVGTYECNGHKTQKNTKKIIFCQ